MFIDEVDRKDPSPQFRVRSPGLCLVSGDDGACVGQIVARKSPTHHRHRCGESNLEDSHRP